MVNYYDERTFEWLRASRRALMDSIRAEGKVSITDPRSQALEAVEKALRILAAL